MYQWRYRTLSAPYRSDNLHTALDDGLKVMFRPAVVYCTLYVCGIQCLSNNKNPIFYIIYILSYTDFWALWKQKYTALNQYVSNSSRIYTCKYYLHVHPDTVCCVWCYRVIFGVVSDWIGLYRFLLLFLLPRWNEIYTSKWIKQIKT